MLYDFMRSLSFNILKGDIGSSLILFLKHICISFSIFLIIKEQETKQIATKYVSESINVNPRVLRALFIEHTENSILLVSKQFRTIMIFRNKICIY